MYRLPSLWYGLLLMFTLTGGINAVAQTELLSHLSKALGSSEKQKRVINLLQNAEVYIHKNLHSDSAIKYLELAIKEARLNGDSANLSIALSLKGFTYGHLLGYLDSAINFCQQAIDIKSDENFYQGKMYGNLFMSSMYYMRSMKDSSLAAADSAYRIAKAHNDSSGIIRTYYQRGIAYTKSGSYPDAYRNLLIAEKLGYSLNDDWFTNFSISFQGFMFQLAGDNTLSLFHYNRCRTYWQPLFLLYPNLLIMAEAHLELNNKDSASWYLSKYFRDVDSVTQDEKIRKRFKAMYKLIPAKVYIALNNLQEARKLLNESKQGILNNKNMLQKLNYWNYEGLWHKAKGNWDSAHFYFSLLKVMAKEHKNLYSQREAAKNLYALFYEKQVYDSAIHYHLISSVLSDSLNAKTLLTLTDLYMIQAQNNQEIESLRSMSTMQDALISEQSQSIKQTSRARNLLLFGLVISLLAGYFVLRNIKLKTLNDKLEQEKKEIALQKSLKETEMQALRAQMNPHFIFNALSAIDGLVQTNQKEKAATYLSLFAKLIRAVLDSSRFNQVPFSTDWENLQVYVRLEQFRSNYTFNYRMQADDALVQGDYHVPPMLVQPFIENAILHGLMNKPEDAGPRELTIETHLLEDSIEYTITDNGIGRKNAEQTRKMNRPAHQSHGLNIAKARLNLNNLQSPEGSIQFTDLYNENGTPAGTEVKVKIALS